MADSPNQTPVFEFLMSLTGNEADTPPVSRIDTHANVVFLAGSRAYKVKRAVRLPFLDYSTLEKRKEACHAEIRLNKPNAPRIYVDAKPVTRDGDGKLQLDGDGEVVEWVVVMNRFDQDDQLDRIAARGDLPLSLCEDLASLLVAAHERANPEPDAADGFLAELSSYLDQNEAAFADHPDLFPPQAADHLNRQSRIWLERIRPLIRHRAANGHIRLCHGDAHLRNIVLMDGRPILFDAIEFSRAMATTDTLYDLAFLVMDLWDRGQRAAANRIFNRYHDRLRSIGSGLDSEEGLAALPFYLMMRAAIRAKIAASAALTQRDETDRKEQQDQARTYFELAISFLDPVPAHLVAIGGLSGSGKTTLAYGLAADVGRAPGARVLRTDVERKKILGIAETEKAPASAYTEEASDKVYASLDAKIQAVLASGHSAIFDAVFPKETEREHIEKIARQVEADFYGLWLNAPADVLKQRVTSRSREADDASDANADVVAQQLDYDLGKMTWTSVNAGQSADITLREARQVIAGARLSGGPE